MSGDPDKEKPPTYEEILAQLQSELDFEVDKILKERHGGSGLSQRIDNASGKEKEFLEEIAQLQRGSVENEVYFRKFNNFALNLPCDRYPGGGFNRAGNLDEPYEADEHNSPLKRGDSRRSFYGNVDRATTDVGITHEDINRLQEDLITKKIGFGVFYKKTLPIYAKLTHKGYIRTDLVR